MKVAITTLGCKSNQYDSSALEEIFRDNDLSVVPFPGPADAYIINTCTVTGRTDYQSRQLIRKARRQNPQAVVIVTGCYAQVSSDEISRIEGVDYVLGNPEKARVLEFIKIGRQEKGAKTFLGPSGEGAPISLRAHSALGRTRANLKVQEGCNRSCSYCIIPRARGASRSLCLEEVACEIEALVANGFKEIVLTGIHLGAYGADLNYPSGIVSILKLIGEKNYPCRFRLSSLDPDEVTDELIEVMHGSMSICNHLHLPLQSGDNSIIRAMRRPYTREIFAERVELAYRKIPQVSIGVDVIAGFPGEGEREFENTFELLKGLPISYMHIFPFSKRKETPAEQMAQTSPLVIRKRCERLKELDDEKRSAFYNGFIGKSAEVLVESARDRKTGLLRGRARNYIPVFLDATAGLKGAVADVLLEGVNPYGMSGAVSAQHKNATGAKEPHSR